jgi:cysteine desulfurase
MSEERRFVYLDNAATTRPALEVADAMAPYLRDRYGNPSALYSIGRDTKNAIEEARRSVAELIGAAPEEVTFTSGGSESDNMALVGTLIANKSKGDHIITTAIEHHAVLETAQWLEKKGKKLTVVPVDSLGVVDPEDIRKAITPGTVIVSVMHANNEVGTVQRLADISKTCREAGVTFHTDAVQTVGNIKVDVNELGVDLLSLSGHKLYGPKGVGAIYIRKGTKVEKFIHGGEQEHGRRASTENICGIVGLGAAARLAMSELKEKAERLTRLRNRLIEGIQANIEAVTLDGHPTLRLPNNAHILIKYIEGEAICLQLDTLGICASTGSACSSEALEPSHVLLAMGIQPLDAHGSVRFGLGRDTTQEDIDYVIEKLPAVVARLRSMSPLTPR